MENKAQWLRDWWQVQAQHVGWGFALSLALGPWLGWWALPAVFVFALVKEAIESIWGVWEPTQPAMDMVADVKGFFWGIVLAAIYFAGFALYPK